MSATAAAKMIAATFRRITPLLKAANIILFVINHITNKVEINPFAHSKSQLLYLKQDETCPGGNTPFYLANNIFRLDDGSKLYEGKDLDIAGCITRVELIKSRTNRAGVSTNLVFNQDIGFDPDLSLYLMLKENGRINGAGAYLYIGDHSDKKFAQKNFKSKLYEDSEFRGYFIDECFNILHNSLYKDQLNVLENSRANSASNDILNRIHQVNNNS
jgi:hypothetical protein